MKIVLLILVATLSGCAPSLEPILRRRGAPTPASMKTPRIAWIQPEDQNRLRQPGDPQMIDDAPLVLREAMRSTAESRGCLSVPVDELDRLVEQNFPGRDLTDGQAARLGSEFDADYVVYGVLDGWKRGALFGRSTTVGFRLTLVDRSGAVLASLTHQGTAAQEDPSDAARHMAQQAADSLIAAWGGCAAGN